MEQSHLDDKTPHIKVLSVGEQEDGQPEITFEVNDEFINMIKKEKNITEISTKELNEYVHALVVNCANKEDGYDYETITTLPEN